MLGDLIVLFLIVAIVFMLAHINVGRLLQWSMTGVFAYCWIQVVINGDDLYAPGLVLSGVVLLIWLAIDLWIIKHRIKHYHDEAKNHA